MSSSAPEWKRGKRKRCYGAKNESSSIYPSFPKGLSHNLKVGKAVMLQAISLVLGRGENWKSLGKAVLKGNPEANCHHLHFCSKNTN